MFSTPQSLKKRTGRFDIDRPAYLRQLVDEYKCKETTAEKREQVLANLANFAYDPINYEYFRRLGVLGLLVANLNEFYANAHAGRLTPVELHFTIAAMCNMCADARTRTALVNNHVLKLVAHYLLVCDLSASAERVETTLSALTLLIFMCDDERASREARANQRLVTLVAELAAKLNVTTTTATLSANDRRISLLATVLLEDHLTKTNSSS